MQRVMNIIFIFLLLFQFNELIASELIKNSPEKVDKSLKETNPFILLRPSKNSIKIRTHTKKGEELYSNLVKHVRTRENLTLENFDDGHVKDVLGQLTLNQVRDSIIELKNANICYYPFGGMDVLNSSFGVSDADLTFVTGSEQWGRINDLGSTITYANQYGGFNSIRDWWVASDFGYNEYTLGPDSIQRMFYGALTNGHPEEREYHVYASNFKLKDNGEIVFLPTNIDELYDNMALWVIGPRTNKLWIYYKLSFPLSISDASGGDPIDSVHNFLRKIKKLGSMIMIEKAIPPELHTDYLETPRLLSPPRELLKAIVTDSYMYTDHPQNIYLTGWYEQFQLKLSTYDRYNPTFGYGNRIHVIGPAKGLTKTWPMKDYAKPYFDSISPLIKRVRKQQQQRYKEIEKQRYLRDLSRHRISLESYVPESSVINNPITNQKLYLVAIYGPARDDKITQPLMKKIPQAWKIKAKSAINYLYVPQTQLREARLLLEGIFSQTKAVIEEIPFQKESFVPGIKVCTKLFVIYNDENVSPPTPLNVKVF